MSSRAARKNLRKHSAGRSFDRIGYANRQGSGSGNVTIPPGGAPAFSNFDAYTLDISAAADDPHPTPELNASFRQMSRR